MDSAGYYYMFPSNTRLLHIPTHFQQKRCKCMPDLLAGSTDASQCGWEIIFPWLGTEHVIMLTVTVWG